MDNSKARLRRYEDDLYVSGTGVIIMGAWGVVKVILGIFLGADSELYLEADSALGKTAVIILTVILVGIISALIMKFHVYIGLNAVRAAKGKKYKKGYIIGTVILLLLTLSGIVGYKDLFKDIDNIDSTIASMLVDLTTAYVCVIVIISTKRINELKQSVTGGEEDHAD